MAKDLEKQNKKLKGKAKANGRVAIILLLILLILAAIYILFKPFGFGLGLLNNGTGGSSASTAAAATSPAPETTTTTASAAEQVSYIDVTIKDAAYILDGNETSADDIVKAVTERDMNTIVRLHNDNGIIDAYDKLVKALEQNSITFEKDGSFDVE